MLLFTYLVLFKLQLVCPSRTFIIAHSKKSTPASICSPLQSLHSNCFQIFQRVPTFLLTWYEEKLHGTCPYVLTVFLTNDKSLKLPVFVFFLSTSTGTTEFDFETDRYDIRIPSDVYNTMNDINPRPDRVTSHIPESVYSLRVSSINVHVLK